MLFNVLPNINEAPYPEQWSRVKITDYPNILDYYSISTYGRVYNMNDQKIIAPRVLESENKYLNASFRMATGGMRTFDIHRMMLITFSPIDNYDTKNLVCNHKDGIKCHNWIWNLEWTNNSGNMIHAINNGLVRMGTDRANGKVPEYFVRQICELIESGMSNNDIAHTLIPPVQCNIKTLINNIKNGHAHSNISKEYDFSKAWSKEIYDRKFTQDQIHILCEAFQRFGRQLSTKDACDIIGVDYDNASYEEKRRLVAAIGGIRNKHNFKYICELYDY